MPRIKTDTIKLVADGREIDLKTSQRGNFALNRALRRPEGWDAFKDDPRKFAGRFGLDIDTAISDQLREHISDVATLDDLQAIGDPGGEVSATVWAVAVGAYSVTSTKIAVAF